MSAVRDCATSVPHRTKKLRAGFSSEGFDSLGVIVADKNRVITHVNKGFFDITGYTFNEVLGKDCKFLQGSDTDIGAQQIIAHAIRNHEPCRVCILNYRKDGLKFWNTLTVVPILGGDGQVSSYVGIQMVMQRPYVDRPLPSFKWTNFPKVPPPYLTDDSGEEEPDSPSSNAAPSPPLVSFVAETKLPTRKGMYRVRAYKDASKPGDESDIIVLIHGEVEKRSDVICRVHDQCFTSEVIHSLKCDCREQLDYAMDFIKDRSLCPLGGMIIYMPQEGRGIGLANKIKAYSMRELGLDTVDANRVLGFEDDYRDYAAVRHILNHLQVDSLQLITNNPWKVDQLQQNGVKISHRIPVVVETNQFSDRYVQSKHHRMGHITNENGR